MSDIKWEYCELEIQYLGIINAKFWFYKPDGKYEQKTVAKYGAFMAQLGLDGWELVASSSHAAFGQTHENSISYIFKRPLKE
jgi:hypothetical protein